MHDQQMKTAILRGPGQLRIADVPDPTIAATTDVLAEIADDRAAMDARTEIKVLRRP
jgi:hypothetical protein